MSFLVVELWPDPESARIVVDPESGKNLVFPNQATAQAEADQCQEGRVVSI
jgi:hypothetical protein